MCGSDKVILIALSVYKVEIWEVGVEGGANFPQVSGLSVANAKSASLRYRCNLIGQQRNPCAWGVICVRKQGSFVNYV